MEQIGAMAAENTHLDAEAYKQAVAEILKNTKSNYGTNMAT
jgi:cytochrome c556